MEQLHSFFMLDSQGLVMELLNEEHAVSMVETYPNVNLFVADLVEPGRRVMFYNDSYGDVYPIIHEEFAQRFAEDHSFGIFFFAEVYDA